MSKYFPLSHTLLEKITFKNRNVIFLHVLNLISGWEGEKGGLEGDLKMVCLSKIKLNMAGNFNKKGTRQKIQFALMDSKTGKPRI